ncbi:MAG: hypothetical protein JNG90_13160 [Planctomycetaceae bacterium]|nr:hypothetical protein [Planctomycetaceae bacterium]
MIDDVPGPDHPVLAWIPRRRQRLIWTAPLVLACLVGCGKNGPPRTAVQGNVQFDGRPLAKGAIRFIPLEDTPGPETATEILAGKYKLAEAEGPPVGKLRVEIRSSGRVPAELTNEQAADKVSSYQLPRDLIPAQYNDRSSLSVEAVAGKINTFNFDLQPREQPAVNRADTKSINQVSTDAK